MPDAELQVHIDVGNHTGYHVDMLEDFRLAKFVINVPFPYEVHFPKCASYNYISTTSAFVDMSPFLNHLVHLQIDTHIQVSRSRRIT